MERLTQTSDKGGVAFTFDLDVTCQPSEMKKILKIAEKLKEYEDLEELIGIPLKVLAEIFNNNVPAECKHPKKAIVLTDDDVDEYREAMEKQKAKKPVDISYLEGFGYYIGFCPNCDNGNTSLTECYCGNCGQKLDWSDTE